MSVSRLLSLVSDSPYNIHRNGPACQEADGTASGYIQKILLLGGSRRLLEPRRIDLHARAHRAGDDAASDVLALRRGRTGLDVL